MKNIKTIVSSEPLSIEKAINFVQNPAHGAIDTFIGTVRNHHNGKEVTGITYDVHKNLAEKMLQDICLEAHNLWPKTSYFVAHRHGVLEIGEQSIIIAVSAPHRDESFKACRYVIEEIKKHAPVWKKEHYIDGKSEWLPGHSLTTTKHTSIPS